MVLADPNLPGREATLSEGSLQTPWNVQDSARALWPRALGAPYFSINLRGHVSVQPRGTGGSLDLLELVEGLQGRNLNLPLLIRFDDILEDRLEGLHAAFERAITRYGYGGRYQGVFPVKCIQQRHVVEELVSCGRRWHFGLEAGSKAAADCPVTDRRPGSAVDLQRLQGSALHRNGDPGQAPGAQARGGDRAGR